MSESTDVIFFYSSADGELARELIGFLKARENSRQFTMWQPLPGDDVNTVISQITGDGLTKGAQVILLFHTKNFFNDSFDDGTLIPRVMPLIMERHRLGWSQVVPISLGYQSIEGSPYAELELLAYKDQPLSFWKKETLIDAACDFIAERVKQYNDKFRKVKRQMSVKEAPPPDYSFLASLCDRDRQKEELGTILNLKDKTEQKKNRFACVIHGRTEEDLSGYKKRLEKNEINRILKTGRKGKIWLIDIPAPKEQSDRNDVAAYIEKTLMKEVYKGKENKKLSDVYDKLRSYKSPIMICYNFRTDHVRTSPKRKSFFNFWSRGKVAHSSDDLRSHIIEPFFFYWNNAVLKNVSPIITCVFFKYDNQIEGDNEVNRKTQVYLENLQFTKYSNLRGNILPKLPPIAREDIDKWVRDENIFTNPCRHNSKQFCDKCVLEFDEEIDNLYTGSSDDKRVIYAYSRDNIEVRIRMRTLRPFLAAQLEKIITRTDSVFRN